MAVRARRNAIVWKKVKVCASTAFNLRAGHTCLAKLLIKKGTWLRTSIESANRVNNRYERKNRASLAKVLGFYSYRGKTPLKIKTCQSIWAEPVLYRVGQTVKPEHKFNKTASLCESGIHFYYRRRDAENH